MIRRLNGDEAMTMTYEKPTLLKIKLSVIEDHELVRNSEKLKQLANHYTLKNHIQTGDPATFLCCAADDMTTPCTQVSEYANMLKKCGVPFELHIFAQGGHGFGICKSF